MKLSTYAALTSVPTICSEGEEPEELIPFADLSDELQALIVKVYLGVFDEYRPTLSDEVAKELEYWLRKTTCKNQETDDDHQTDEQKAPDAL